VTFPGGYGHLVVGGLSLPIVGFELSGGRIWIVAARHGPFALKGGPVTVFGADGIGVCQGADVEAMIVGEGHCLNLRVELRIGAVDEEPASPPGKSQEAR
jgi:hypothetical protein